MRISDWSSDVCSSDLFALGSCAIDGGPAATQTTAGIRIDQRAARVQPNGDKHDLEISNDLGTTFNVIGSFVEYDIARSFGDAWVEGRIEKAGADRKSTRLNSSQYCEHRMPSSA